MSGVTAEEKVNISKQTAEEFNGEGKASLGGQRWLLREDQQKGTYRIPKQCHPKQRG